MPFTPGDEVHVAAVGKGVVREARNGGRYLVDVNGRAIVASEGQLTPVTRRPRKPLATHDNAPAQPAPRSPAPASLDLHGMTADEGAAALDAFLNDALLAGHSQVQVIHGRSGGRLKAAVHARLKRLPVVHGFRLDPRNPGVTIVTL